MGKARLLPVLVGCALACASGPAGPRTEKAQLREPTTAVAGRGGRGPLELGELDLGPGAESCPDHVRSHPDGRPYLRDLGEPDIRALQERIESASYPTPLDQTCANLGIHDLRLMGRYAGTPVDDRLEWATFELTERYWISVKWDHGPGMPKIYDARVDSRDAPPVFE